MLLQHLEITLSDGRKGVFTGHPIAHKDGPAAHVTEILFHEPVDMEPAVVHAAPAIAIDAKKVTEVSEQTPAKQKLQLIKRDAAPVNTTQPATKKHPGKRRKASAVKSG
jgi:hypothetical protein